MAVDQVQIGQFGGLNTNAPIDQIGDNEFSVLENMVVRRGALQKRRGCNLRQDISFESERYVAMGSAEITSSRVSYIFYMDYSDTRLLTTFLGGYVTNDSEFVVLSSNVSELRSNLLSGSEGIHLLIELDSTSEIYLVRIVPFDAGSEVTNIAGPFDRTPHWIFEHQDRMWVVQFSSGVGSGLEGTAIVFSDPGDYTTTPTGIASENTIIIPNFFCYEAVPLEDKVLFFGEKGIWVLHTQGSPRNWSLRQLDANITIPACREVTAVDDSDRKGYQQATLKYKGAVYFLAQDGFYVTDGVEIRRLSDKVQNLMRQSLDISFASITLTEYPGICLFDHLNDEILVKTIYDSNKPPKYLIYNISNSCWSEFKFGLDAPEGAATNGSEIEALLSSEDIPYPYSFESMFYIFPTIIDTHVPGIHFGSSSHLTEQNKIYSIRASARPDSEYFYADGLTTSVAASTPFLSKIRSKAFDFGFKGINKKVSKQYLTIKRVNEDNTQIEPDDYPLPLTISRIINGTALSDIELTLDYSMRYLKIAGPGYFIEYEIELSDPDNKAFWEFQSMAFDLIAKPELLENSGVGTSGQI